MAISRSLASDDKPQVFSFSYPLYLPIPSITFPALPRPSLNWSSKPLVFFFIVCVKFDWDDRPQIGGSSYPSSFYPLHPVCHKNNYRHRCIEQTQKKKKKIQKNLKKKHTSLEKLNELAVIGNNIELDSVPFVLFLVSFFNVFITVGSRKDICEGKSSISSAYASSHPSTFSLIALCGLFIRHSCGIP